MLYYLQVTTVISGLKRYSKQWWGSEVRVIVRERSLSDSKGAKFEREGGLGYRVGGVRLRCTLTGMFDDG